MRTPRSLHGASTVTRRALLAFAMFVTTACSGYSDVTDPHDSAPPPPPPGHLLLKDVVVSNLPSPFYHFDYDEAGTITGASFASGLRSYVASYGGGKLREMRNIVPATDERLVYSYDDAGRVGAVHYVDANGSTFTVVIYTYEGARLTGVERQRRLGGPIVTDKRVALFYDADENLEQLIVYRPYIAGVQDETTTIDTFGQYDAGINVDGFGLLHDDFFDHFVVLPGVRLQKSNPRRQTRTGDGQTFTIDYGYDYAAGRPLGKHGDLTITNGADAGKHVQVSSTYTYY